MGNKNPLGINYENIWLNQDQETVIELLTQELEKNGLEPNQFKNGQGKEFKSFDDFVGFWKVAFPDIKDEVKRRIKFDEIVEENLNSKYWGSLNGISVVRGGIIELQKLGAGHKQINDFLDKVLVIEAIQVLSGKQKSISEKDEQ